MIFTDISRMKSGVAIKGLTAMASIENVVYMGAGYHNSESPAVPHLVGAFVTESDVNVVLKK